MRAVAGSLVRSCSGDAEVTQRGIAGAQEGEVLVDDAQVGHGVATYVAITDTRVA